MKRVFLAALGVIGVAIWGWSGRGELGVKNEWALVPNAAAWPLGAWGLPLAVLVLFGGAAVLSVYDRFKRAKTAGEQRNSTRTALVCLALLGLLWPWTLLGPGEVQRVGAPSQLSRLTLEGRFNVLASLWSDVSTEYFGKAYQINDAREFSRSYTLTEQNPTSRALAHVATHPPGATLFFYGVRRFVEGVPGLSDNLNALAAKMTGLEEPSLAATLQQVRVSSSLLAGAPPPSPLPRGASGVALLCAFLMGLSLVLALPAVYGLAASGPNEQGQAEARGLLACALWILAPSLNLYAFSLDALVASCAAWTLFFAARAAREGNARWAVATGVTLALASMLSFGALALGILVLGAWFLCRTPRLVRTGAFAVGTFVGLWILASLWGGFNPVEVAQKARAAHDFATLSTRSYWPWVVLNGFIWAIFCGVPLLVAGIGVARKGKELIIRSGASEEARRADIAVAFALAAIFVLVLLSLSGNVRGEVERLWLFFLAPLAACASVRSRKAAAMLAVLQGVQTLCLAATFAPLVRPF